MADSISDWLPPQRARTLCLAVVFLHLIVAIVHGATHELVPVQLATWQIIFVITFPILLPLFGSWIMYRKDSSLGGAVIAAAMFASFVFGGLYHFVFDTPDNICRVADSAWSHLFVSSAILVAILEFCGLVMGLLVWRGSET